MLLVSFERSLQRGVQGLCFMAFGPWVWKLLNSEGFYDSENEMKLSLHSFVHRASICANFMACEPLM